MWKTGEIKHDLLWTKGSPAKLLFLFLLSKCSRLSRWKFCLHRDEPYRKRLLCLKNICIRSPNVLNFAYMMTKAPSHRCLARFRGRVEVMWRSIMQKSTNGLSLTADINQLACVVFPMSIQSTSFPPTNNQDSTVLQGMTPGMQDYCSN